MKRTSWFKWLLVVLLVLATVLRIWGLDWGLPYLYDPDEPNKIEIAQRIFKTGDLNPHYFKKPSLFIYLNTLLYVPFYAIGKLLGIFGRPSDIPAPQMIAMGSGRIAMPSIVLMGRGLSVVFSLASVVLGTALAWRLTRNRWASLLGAWLLAISPTSIWIAHRIRSDTFLVFFALLCLWYALAILERGDRRAYIGAGLAGGLAASSKYNGALILVYPLLAHFMRKGRDGFRDKWIYLCGSFSVIAFVATTPYALLDAQAFTEELLGEYLHYAGGHAGMEGNSAQWYLSYLLTSEGPIYVFVLVAIVYAFWAGQRQMILVSMFSLLYLGLIVHFPVRNDRTLFPALAFMAILLCQLLSEALSWLGRQRRAVAVIGGSLLLALVCSSSAVAARSNGQWIRMLTVTDSRTTAVPWIEENLPAGAKIGVEAYAPFISPAHFEVVDIDKLIDHSLEWYRAEGFDYVVISEWEFGLYLYDSANYPQEAAQYEALFEALVPVKVFQDGGYEVRIYRVP